MLSSPKRTLLPWHPASTIAAINKSKARPIAHAMVLAAALLATACASSPAPPITSLDTLRRGWYYVPGPYATVQRTEAGTRRARVSAEANDTWTVTIGDPPTTIVVTRLPDGRPATARIANPDRNETAVFDPPLALVPADEPIESTTVTLYSGLHPFADLDGTRPKRSGQADRRFLNIEDTTWTLDGNTYPAQRLTHELVLSLSPATVRQAYESLAVENMGIVMETISERITVLGVRIGGRDETTEVVEFIDDR